MFFVSDRSHDDHLNRLVDVSKNAVLLHTQLPRRQGMVPQRLAIPRFRERFVHQLPSNLRHDGPAGRGGVETEVPFCLFGHLDHVFRHARVSFFREYRSRTQVAHQLELSKSRLGVKRSDSPVAETHVARSGKSRGQSSFLETRGALGRIDGGRQFDMSVSKCG